MTRVLVVADAQWARNDVHASLTTPDYELVDHDGVGQDRESPSLDHVQGVDGVPLFEEAFVDAELDSSPAVRSEALRRLALKVRQQMRWHGGSRPGARPRRLAG